MQQLYLRDQWAGFIHFIWIKEERIADIKNRNKKHLIPVLGILMTQHNSDIEFCAFEMTFCLR